MRKFFLLLCLCLVIFAISKCSCGGDSDNEVKDDTANESIIKKEVVQKADHRARIFTDKAVKRENTLIVISKKELSLTVYEKKGDEFTLIARYPVCLSKNKGQKQESGDMRTPESEENEPFTITEIKDASFWEHDFGDGRGKILAYGNWFLRLSYGHGIGIHGSTNNRWSVPGSGEVVPKGKTVGHDSEGCIRMLDEDLDHLHDNYAHIDMPVYIKHENQGNLSFENNIKNKEAKGKLLATTTTANEKYTASKERPTSNVGEKVSAVKDKKNSANYDKYSEGKSND